MLDKKNRLTRRKEFNYIYKKGKGVSNDFLTVVYVESKFKTPRIGFSVTSKTGNAVIRNKIKRRLRVIIREFLFNIKENINYIFVAKPTMKDAEFLEIKAKLKDLLKKAKLWVENPLIDNLKTNKTLIHLQK